MTDHIGPILARLHVEMVNAEVERKKIILAVLYPDAHSWDSFRVEATYSDQVYDDAWDRAKSEDHESYDAQTGLIDGLDRAIAIIEQIACPRLTDAEALDKLNLLLSASEWPGASGMEDVCEIVRGTGRTIVPDAPEWRSH